MVSMNSGFQGPLTLLFRSYQVGAPAEDPYFLERQRDPCEEIITRAFGQREQVNLTRLGAQQRISQIIDLILAEGSGQFEGIGDKGLKKALFKNPCI